MSRGLDGINPLAYVGVEPNTPPNLFVFTRNPLATDFNGFNIGDFWLNSVAQDLFVLTSVLGVVASWALLTTVTGTVDQIQTDLGPFIAPLNGIIDLTGVIPTPTIGFQGNSGIQVISGSGFGLAGNSAAITNRNALASAQVNTTDATVTPIITIIPSISNALAASYNIQIVGVTALAAKSIYATIQLGVFGPATGPLAVIGSTTINKQLGGAGAAGNVSVTTGGGNVLVNVIGEVATPYHWDAYSTLQPVLF
jgi:hypothetical protein